MTEAKEAIKAIQTRRRSVPDLLDEDTWRSFLLAATGGQSSLRAMTDGQRAKVLDALVQKGAKTGPGRQKLAGDPQARKMRALWITLHQVRAVDDGSEQALAKWCGGQLGVPVDHIGWLPAADKRRLIQSLIGWCGRLGLASKRGEKSAGSEGGDHADQGRAGAHPAA